MTSLLQQAFSQAAKLSDAEQDLLAAWLLAEMSAEDAFDQKLEQTAGKLAAMADKAILEYRAGQTRELLIG